MATAAKLRYQKKYNREHADEQVARRRARRHAIAEGRVSIGDKRDIDHKVPLDKGGSTAKSNTRVVSREHNRGWRKRTPGMYGKND